MKLCVRCGRSFDTGTTVCPDDGSSLADVNDPDQPAADPVIGTTLDGRYLVERRLGAGGMGAVYLARQTAVGRQVAVKILPPAMATDLNAVTRFMHEARAASALTHPNTITIFDFGRSEDGRLYLAMEYVSGPTLSAIVSRSGRMSPERAVGLVVQVLDAIAEAHDAGITHRDLKPDNILVIDRPNRPDFVKVLDFGLAKIVDAGRAGTMLTRTGDVMGTPAYMSPEQARGQPAGHQADLYSIGVVLYELLAGRLPFESDSPLGLLVKHMSAPPPSFAALDPPIDVPPALAEVVMRALAKQPEERFASAAHMRAAIIDSIGFQGIGRTSSATHPSMPSHPESTVRSVRPPSMGTADSAIRGEVLTQPVTRSSHRNLRAAAVAVVFAAGAGGVAWYFTRGADAPTGVPAVTAPAVAEVPSLPAAAVVTAAPASAPAPSVAAVVTAAPPVVAVAAVVIAATAAPPTSNVPPTAMSAAATAPQRARFAPARAIKPAGPPTAGRGAAAAEAEITPDDLR